ALARCSPCPYTMLFRSRRCPRAELRAAAGLVTGSRDPLQWESGVMDAHGRGFLLRPAPIHHEGNGEDQRPNRHDRSRGCTPRERSEEHTYELQSRENIV